MQTMVDDQHYPDDEISLLDLMVVIAEHWLILVFVPLLAGLAAYGFVALQPHAWTASAEVGLPPAEVSRYLPGILDGAADMEHGLEITEGSSAERSRIDLTLDDPDAVSDGLLLLTGQLTAAVEEGGIELPGASLEANLLDLEQEIALRDGIATRLAQALRDIETGLPFDAMAYAQTASALNEMMAARDAQRLRYEELSVTGTELPTSLIEEAPSEPVPAGRTSPLVVSALAVLGTGFVLLVLIFIRNGWKNAAADAETQDKIDRIRRAFGLRARARK